MTVEAWKNGSEGWNMTSCDISYIAGGAQMWLDNLYNADPAEYGGGEQVDDFEAEPPPRHLEVPVVDKLLEGVRAFCSTYNVIYLPCLWKYRIMQSKGGLYPQPCFNSLSIFLFDSLGSTESTLSYTNISLENECATINMFYVGFRYIWLTTSFSFFLGQTFLELRDRTFALLKQESSNDASINAESLYYIHIQLTDLCIMVRDSDLTWAQLKDEIINNQLRASCRDIICQLAIDVYGLL